jgi:hypothetical protein
MYTLYCMVIAVLSLFLPVLVGEGGGQLLRKRPVTYLLSSCGNLSGYKLTQSLAQPCVASM